MYQNNPYANPYSALTGRVGRVGAANVAIPSLTPGYPGSALAPYPVTTMMGPPPVTVAVPGTPGAPIGALWPELPAQVAYGGCAPLSYVPPQPAAFYQQAARAAAAAQAPQSQLGCNSREQGAGGVPPIAAGAPATLRTSPTVNMCITGYRVSRVSASFFQLSSIRAQKVEFLSDTQTISADIFTADTTAPPIRMACVSPGTNITVGVLNIGADPHDFWSQFIGFDQPGGYPCL